MIESIIEFSIRHRALVIVAGLALALWGVYAAAHTPIDAIPNLSENQVIVFTDWPGHSPREIEDQVTYPLSVNLQGLQGVRVVRSSSDFGFSSINVIFEDSVDYGSARTRVAERLTRLGSLLPVGVAPYLTPDAVATGQIFWYTVEGLGYHPGRLRAIQDWYVRQQLAGVPGVAEVASVGGFPQEYLIEVDPYRLASYGLTAQHVVDAVGRSNGAVGGHVVQKANAEYLVRGLGWLGAHAQGEAAAGTSKRVKKDLEKVVLVTRQGGAVLLSDVARVSLAPQFRRGVLEKDGSEVTGGVVLMRHGENPLEVTRRIHQKIEQLSSGLPPGVRVVPMYDRTPLIEGAIGTVRGTLIEAIITATVCVILVLGHFRTSLIIAVTLPLAALGSFAMMWTLRQLGIANIQANIMSLAGIAISIGVLVDSSIVMAENAMHILKTQFGDRPVKGDVRQAVLRACRTVGRPIFFSVLIMLVSFLPVFAFGGMEGKMFRPLAFTKSFALVTVAALAITLVPALCTILIKGRLRGERENWLVRGVIEVYRPVLSYFIDHPVAVGLLMGVTFLVGFAPVGNHTLFLGTLLVFLVICGLLARTLRSRVLVMGGLVSVALVADQWIDSLGREFMTPLDEGMIMDMPITIPRASITQSGDDLKARDMMLCRFPEVEMVVGKAGRAETSTDPAPMDMIETMVGFRPRQFWPRRKLRPGDAHEQAVKVLASLIERNLVAAPEGDMASIDVVNESVMAALPRFDSAMREYAFQGNQEMTRRLGGRLASLVVARLGAQLHSAGALERQPTAEELAMLASSLPARRTAVLAMAPTQHDINWIARRTVRELERIGAARRGGDHFREPAGLRSWVAPIASGILGRPPSTMLTRLREFAADQAARNWREHTKVINDGLAERGPETFTRIVLEELLHRSKAIDPRIKKRLDELAQLRAAPTRVSRASHHGTASRGPLPMLEPFPELDSLQSELARKFGDRVLLWQARATGTAPIRFLGASDSNQVESIRDELHRVVQMPGWTNIWTYPIQNRVDMLATGVNTAIGIRVLGRSLDDVVRVSQQVAEVVKRVPGSSDVVADPIRGKGYLEISVNRAKAARLGISVADVNDTVETALAGRVATTSVEGRERHPVRVRYSRAWRDDEQSVRRLLVPTRPKATHTESAGVGTENFGTQPAYVPLEEVADVRLTTGPATIKSENGLLRNYVRVNVRGRGTGDFVDEAKRAVAAAVRLPEAVSLEWTGQFEHEVRAARTLRIVWPIVIGLIFGILYLTYHDLLDALLVVVAVPGAVAGGVFFQWLFGYNLSVTIYVGYIACFGMATATGIIMLVYLREAVEKAGGLESLSVAGLRQAVMDGAVHRLRPKLLTEATTVIALLPMLWATGTGAEVIKPMAAPVLGGILIADEVIDLFLPVMFYWGRRFRLGRIRRQPDSGALSCPVHLLAPAGNSAVAGIADRPVGIL